MCQNLGTTVLSKRGKYVDKTPYYVGGFCPAIFLFPPYGCRFWPIRKNERKRRMSQGTFWDGDEKDAAEYGKTVAKITLANLLEEDLKKEAEAVKARPEQPKKPRRDFRIGASQPESEPEVMAVAEVEAEVEVVEAKEVTAEHVAAQLVKLWRMGVISGAEDPEAAFFAAVLKETGGTVRG